MELDLKNHIVMTSSEEVSLICSPLFKYFNTTYFNFVRRFIDGSETCLTTNPEWTSFFYENKLYKQVLSDKFAKTKSLVNKLKIIPWSEFTVSPVRLAQSEYFGVGIGITLIFTRSDHTDFFHFGTDNNNVQMTELYLSYADCLIQFAYYFYDQGHRLIEKSTRVENRITILDRPMVTFDCDYPQLEKFCIQNFIKEASPKKYIIYTEAMGKVLLTKKELSCISLYTQGKTSGEIAATLVMSKRTVETHLKNIRQKLGLRVGASKADIISELYESGFDVHNLIII